MARIYQVSRNEWNIVAAVELGKAKPLPGNLRQQRPDSNGTAYRIGPLPYGRNASRLVMKFDYGLDFARIDFKKHPGLYRIGRGEQGVLLVQPYKGELLPHWRFATPALAKQSATELYKRFLQYGRDGDFVGMDMARKYLQMGTTRSRRYANHRTGHKYEGPVPKEQRGRSGAHGRKVRPLDPDPVKAECAAFFKAKLQQAQKNATYQRLRREHIERYEHVDRNHRGSVIEPA